MKLWLRRTLVLHNLIEQMRSVANDLKLSLGNCIEAKDAQGYADEGIATTAFGGASCKERCHENKCWY